MSHVLSFDNARETGGAAGMRPEFLSTLLANLEGMVYRCRFDAEWTMEFVSQGCLGLTGYPPSDLLYNSRISYESITHPGDRQMIRELISGAVERHRRFELEYRIVRADGSVCWVWERGAALYDVHGRVLVLEGFIHDISQRVQAEAGLREAERRYRSIFENAVEGIFQSTPDRGYLAVNPALARMYGFDSPQQLVQTVRYLDRQLYVDSRRRAEFLAAMEKHGSVTNFESRIYRRDGEIIWISENARAVRDQDGKLLFYEGMVEDITERKTYEARIRFQATHDPLTGLPNRALLRDRMQQAVLQVQARACLGAVVFVDLDQFKYINDSLGHEAGDQLLITVADRLKSGLRKEDTVARLGGDEFVLLLLNQPDRHAILQAMQRLLQAVAQPWHANGMELQVTCSMGVAVFPTDGSDVDALLRNADAAMYKAKQSGRNNFQFFAADMNQAATARLEMLQRLRRALSQDELALHYQPKVCAADRTVVGLEALLRWPGGDGIAIQTGHMIALAEETGLILPIGEWVLRSACAQAMAWQRAGHPALPVSVNISPLQLERGNIVQLVARVLHETGLPAHLLELEITESVVMRDVAKSLSVLKRLKSLGVALSIDDFGTGYSSLSYLQRLPVDTLKIDKSFVLDLALDQDGAAIVRAIISLAHTLNLKVLAEGVESEQQLAFLLECGCDQMQGYYFSRPLPAAQLFPLAGAVRNAIPPGSGGPS